MSCSDSTEFWRRKNFRKTAAFTVLMAYGYDLAYGPHPEPPDPFMGPPTNYHRGRLLAAMVFPTPNREAWAQFLGSRDGDPAVVVADGSKAITRALAHRWPRARGVTPPEFVRCQWHLANNLRKAAGRDIKRINATRTGAGAATEALLHPDTHPLVADAAGAVSRPKAWRDYRDMAYALLGHHRAFTDERPSSVLAWLHDRESLVLSQQARRGQRLGPASIGPLEGHIGTVRPWLARRAQAIRNPDRTNLLLALMVEGINHTASRAAWADRIYEELADHDRKPLRTQRRLVGRTF